jgi:hydrogenase maturation protease
MDRSPEVLATMKTLVLGLGNLLLCDEGVGVHAARALLEEGCPDGVTILDVGTAILGALPDIEAAERIIVVDAVKAGGIPGSVYKMPFSDFIQKPVIASMHGFDLSRVLALAGRTDPPEVVVVGVEPAVIDWSMDLSPQVAASFHLVLDTIREEIGESGGNVYPDTQHDR